MSAAKRVFLIGMVSAFALTPLIGHAQVRIVPVVGGNSFFYRPTTFGGFSNPYYAGYGAGFAGYNGSLAASSYYGLNSSAYWQGAYSGPIYYQGWWAGSSNTPRMRSRMEPAVRIPSYSDKSVNLASYTAGEFTTPAAAKPVAHLEVRLPCSDARVWVQGVATQQTGVVRHFATPELNPGCHYHYNVKACWNTPGGPCERVYTVRVWRGCRTRVVVRQ